jgi:hypothetical protein
MVTGLNKNEFDKMNVMGKRELRDGAAALY